MFHVKQQQGEGDAGNTTKERRNKSRVRQKERAAFDIHDRVNYAVTESKLKIEKDRSMIALNLQIDESICSMYDYFEIFLGRMMLCRKSAEILGTTVKRTFAIRFATCSVKKESRVFQAFLFLHRKKRQSAGSSDLRVIYAVKNGKGRLRC